MATAAHTPGPWTYIGKVREVLHDSGASHPWCGYITPAIPQKYRGEIARIQSADQIGGISTDEAHANARLIAAAPDMLALLRKLIDDEGPQPGTSEMGEQGPRRHREGNRAGAERGVMTILLIAVVVSLVLLALLVGPAIWVLVETAKALTEVDEP